MCVCVCEIDTGKGASIRRREGMQHIDGIVLNVTYGRSARTIEVLRLSV